MQKIRFIQSVDGFGPGQIVTVENNVAHRYIDRGQAVLAAQLETHDRMLGGKNTKHGSYKTKAKQ